MFDKVLIANRGEVAIRIARTCERLGIQTVAVYSEAEPEALHVSQCDEAVCIGPAAASASYANIEAILAAAKKTGAQAVHPGYGFLAENPRFITAVQEAGLTFVGPSAQTMELFGDKVRARELAQFAGVRVVPGGEEAVTDSARALELGERLGYPLMVKAAAGGGGIGMLHVESPHELERAVRTCMDRAQTVFGDGRVFLERFVDRPRHLEVQVLGDAEGHYVALGERECSIQRRHQKFLEESPSPALACLSKGELRREVLCDAAIRIAREAEFHGVGTAEFMMDPAGGFHFLEFNARLQVEHGVTEMCTGLDLVEAQLRVAAGEPLPTEFRQVTPSGHAIETRICAEDPAQNFRPSPGPVEVFRWPTVAPGALRVEASVAAGGAMTPHYDPLVAKMITCARTRHHALLTMDRVLAETELGPITTNIGFLRRILADESFRAGQYDVSFVEQLLSAPPATD